MIWAAIWGGSNTEIYLINRGKESAQWGYSSCSYLLIIEYYLQYVTKNLPTFYTFSQQPYDILNKIYTTSKPSFPTSKSNTN